MKIHRLAANSISLMLAQVINKAAIFVLFIVAARYLGSVVFGKYSFALIVVTLGYMVVDFGLSLLIFREMAKEQKSAAKWFVNSIYMKFGLAVASYLGVMVFLEWMDIPKDTHEVTRLLALTLFPYAVSSSLDALFKSFEQMHYVLLSSLFMNGVLLFGGGYLLIAGYTLGDFILFQVIVQSLNAILMLLIAHRKVSGWRFGLDLNLCRRMLRDAFPLAALAFLGVLYFRVDIIFLEKLQGEEVVGWYNAAYKLMDSLMILSGGVLGALFPSFSRLGSPEYQSELKVIFENTLKYFFMAGLPMAVLITVLADGIISLVYGEGYKPAAKALQILIWAIPMIYVNGVFLYALIAVGKQRVCAIGQGLCAVGNILLNFLLIPFFGYLGAATATVLSEIITLAVFYSFVGRYLFPFDLKAVMFKPALAVTLMGLPLYGLRQSNLLVMLVFSIAVYVASLILFGVISSKEINFIKRHFIED